MSNLAQVQAKAQATQPQSFTRMPGTTLQRKCVCGSSLGMNNQCGGCGSTRLTAQRFATNHTEPSTVQGEPGKSLDPASSAFPDPPFGHDFSRMKIYPSADFTTTGPSDQPEAAVDQSRKSRAGEAESSESDSESDMDELAQPAIETSPAPAPAPAPAIEEPSVEDIEPGEAEPLDTRKTKTTVKIVSETVATMPADRTRKTIGIGEEVNCSTDPATTAAWSVTGGGAVDTASGTSTKFTAKKSPSTSTVKARIGRTNLTITFKVVAPDGLKSTVSSNPGNGTAGPPNNRIGFKTIFDCVVQPDTVAFHKVEFQENIPQDTWTWPDSTADSNGPKTVPWTVGQDNKTTDTVSSALRPIGRLSDGTDNKDFSYTIRVPEDYKDDAGKWVTWLPNETHLKAFEGATQKGRGTLNATNVVSGSWQGPWQ